MSTFEERRAHNDHRRPGGYLLDAATAAIPAAEATIAVDLSDVARAADRGTWTLGRSSRCDVCMRQSRSVSRLHADLSLRDGIWRLRDRGSRNGTWVGTRRITHLRLDEKVPVRLGHLEIWWSFGR